MFIPYLFLKRVKDNVCIIFFYLSFIFWEVSLRRLISFTYMIHKFSSWNHTRQLRKIVDNFYISTKFLNRFSKDYYTLEIRQCLINYYYMCSIFIHFLNAFLFYFIISSKLYWILNQSYFIHKFINLIL